ncbi:hypothetical protein Barb7_02267 [Bacteroidales bacterium Barb7]|nr:hypothetical protein Barb7_02267 [Bacteroidales bacterium Barb7]
MATGKIRVTRTTSATRKNSSKYKKTISQEVPILLIAAMKDTGKTSPPRSPRKGAATTTTANPTNSTRPTTTGGIICHNR